MQPDMTKRSMDGPTHGRRTVYFYLWAVFMATCIGLLVAAVDTGGRVAPPAAMGAVILFLGADMVCWPRRYAKAAAPAPSPSPEQRFAIAVTAFDNENPEHVAQLEAAVRSYEQSDAAMRLSVAQRIAKPTSRTLPPA